MSETDNEKEVQPEAEEKEQAPASSEDAAESGTEETTEATTTAEDDVVPASGEPVDELISQDEMDALLKGVSEGDLAVETMEEREPGKAVKYDFAHPAHKLKARLPMMVVINDRIATSLAPSLSMLLHQPVDVTVEEFTAYKFHEYTHSLPASVSISRIKLHPLPASSIVAIDGGLVFTIVDCFFGGSGHQGQKELRRHFTPTEQRIIERVLATTLETIGEAWKPTFPVQPEYIRSELSTEITSPANPSEVMLVTKFKLELTHGAGELHLAIPYSSIDPARNALTAALDNPGKPDNAWTERFTEMVIDAPVELQGVIAETELSLGELLNLKEGDFIPLGSGNRARFFAENIPLFEATIGAANGMISARLVDADNSYQQ